MGQPPLILPSRGKAGLRVGTSRRLGDVQNTLCVQARRAWAHCVTDQDSNVHVARRAVVQHLKSNQDNQKIMGQMGQMGQVWQMVAPSQSPPQGERQAAPEIVGQVGQMGQVGQLFSGKDTWIGWIGWIICGVAVCQGTLVRAKVTHYYIWEQHWNVCWVASLKK